MDLFSFRYVETCPNSTAQGLNETRIVLRENELENMLSLISSAIEKLYELEQRFALIIPGYADTEPVICRPASGESALLAALEALTAIDYRGQTVALPSDEIRRIRRKLGTVYQCAWSDVPTQAEALGALGVARLRCIACLRDETAKSVGETDSLLLGELTGAAPEGGAA